MLLKRPTRHLLSSLHIFVQMGLIKEANPNLFAKVGHCVLRKCLLLRLYQS